MVGADHSHVYLVQNIVSGKVHTAHVARLRFYADADLNITAEVKDVFSIRMLKVNVGLML